MAKYRHSIFEMYDFRDEAVASLSPNSNSPATEAHVTESWALNCLLVSRNAGVTEVTFQENTPSSGNKLADLQGDLEELSRGLPKNSKVLLDFGGVSSFDAASIKALVSFKQQLQIKGSRVVLCCLEPGPRNSFFAPSSQLSPPLPKSRRR